MFDEALLLGIASIAAVIAGFTAVTAALTPPGGSWSQVHRIRQRAIVSTSFNVVFEALLPVIVFAGLADAREAVVVSSALVALYAAWIVLFRGRQLPAASARGAADCCTCRASWPSRCSQRMRSCSARWRSTPSRCASNCPWRSSASTSWSRPPRAKAKIGDGLVTAEPLARCRLDRALTHQAFSD